MLTGFALGAFAMTYAGGLLPLSQRLLSRAGLSRLFSLRAGLLLAVAFTEVLPEAWHTHPASSGWGALAAFGLLFLMGNFAMLDTCPEYLEDCRVHYLGWATLLALSAHSLLDGINLSLAFAAGERAGFAVGLALALHKVADGFTLTTTFRQAGYGRSKSLWALTAVAATTPLGAGLSALGVGALPPAAEAALLGFAAGSFIYIAAADLLPRLHKSADRGGLAYFGAGLLGMAALKIL